MIQNHQILQTISETLQNSRASFPAGSTWYWQLSGDVVKSHTVNVYNFDLEDNESNGLISELKSKGIKVICYFSAGTYEDWRSDKDQFSSDQLGKALPDWPGERWLDIRKESVRKIMSSRIQRAVNAGCDGIEPDNIDGYQNKNGLGITEQDQIDYLHWLAAEAHLKKISIGLKNSLDIIQKGLLHKHFDFVINEECYNYNECDLLKPFIEQIRRIYCRI